MKKYFYMLLALCMMLISFSCKKGLLDDKPDKSLLIPESLSDFQALLDNIIVMNGTPGLQNLSADDYYTTDAGWQSLLTPMERNSYLWLNTDMYEGATAPDWDVPYQQVFYANVVLDGLAALKPDSTNANSYNQIKGSALFYRAFAFYNLAQTFAAPYDASTSDQLPGIPIRLHSDVNVKSTRGTLQQTYNQIITDLNGADLLLSKKAAFKSRPCQTAVLALLAKVYLSMNNYTAAQSFASACLSINSSLIDYNNLTVTASKPIPSPLTTTNDEVIYYSFLNSYSFHRAALTYADSNLYSLYDATDLRKTAFFKLNGNGYNFKGTYTGNVSTFSGLATDEIFLIRAECYARLNNVPAAISDLNTLLAKRYKTGTYQPFQTNDVTDALTKIFQERRKELIGRGERWTDLRRLNKDSRFATTLNKIILGKSYTLLPNSNRYVFPIPDDEIKSNGIEQNPQ